MTRVAVIMAGGSGERFWPLSRKNHPKQLLKLTSPDMTMLHEAVNRLAPIIPLENIYVQTMPHLVEAIRVADLGIAQENILAEPCKRNTAGCLIYAVAQLLARYGGDGREISMAVVTADHIIGDSELFRATVTRALEAGEADPVLVTMGIAPTEPATGFGYIQTKNANAVAAVQAFHEKPALEKAKEYVAAGNYFWNSGMFFWKASTFLAELAEAQPKMAEILHQLRKDIERKDEAAAQKTFERLENISIDYALMEKAQRVAMIRADFPWDDIGTWAALDRTRTPDADGNIAEGGPVLVECKNCIVYNDGTASQRSVSVVGAENLVVVVTHDAVLVIPKDRTEEVKKAVQELERRGAPHL